VYNTKWFNLLLDDLLNTTFNWGFGFHHIKEFFFNAFFTASVISDAPIG
jgi:hypothetical protein